ncbi:2-hydroxychromene-2-carboxylate isomerase [Burkholderia sp. Ac-20353]|uniref:2-hydroxychromene-2-carboxylate isomerase n=1 Tax=Burkholderia sp. Ac-20353 TaxID=2703894 RepID=UPI00197C8570|nr:2-hydroxychromene-2-carboxylate isomerase [Burkholderia sp. Ac-20353]MBN3787156.1 2-hydroxychromene-2-carboxylate isomerase [Burkholderia sp. Ac-20353]
MTKDVRFFFDVGSPASYLAWTQLPEICAKADARLIYKPMLLGGVFQATGNASPAVIPAKGRYTNHDYQRYARKYGVPFASNPHFPIITLFLMRVVTGVQLREPERLQELLRAVFKAMWVDSLNLNEPELTARTLAEAGFDPQDMQALAANQEVKAALKAVTDEAVGQGVFGAPTTFVGEEMFFGQDRLDMIREELAR